MTKSKKYHPKKTKKGLTLHASGQYRADVDGRTIYLGTDPKGADKRYELYMATKLCWSRTYRQFVKEIAGTIRAFGKTVEVAQANYERFVAENWQKSPQPEPAPIISNCNIVNGEFDVKTIGDVANAYVAWCFKHRSDKHGLDSRSVFRHFAELLGRDSLIINLSAGDFAAYRKHCLKTIGSRFNKHMRIIKAAFRRCRREQWLCVSKGWLEDMLDPLELKTIVSEEWDIFKPHEFKLILDNTPDQLEVIIILALNCALGNKDIAALQWRDIVCFGFPYRLGSSFSYA